MNICAKPMRDYDLYLNLFLLYNIDRYNKPFFYKKDVVCFLSSMKSIFVIHDNWIPRKIIVIVLISFHQINSLINFESFLICREISLAIDYSYK